MKIFLRKEKGIGNKKTEKTELRKRKVGRRRSNDQERQRQRRRNKRTEKMRIVDRVTRLPQKRAVSYPVSGALACEGGVWANLSHIRPVLLCVSHANWFSVVKAINTSSITTVFSVSTSTIDPQPDCGHEPVLHYTDSALYFCVCTFLYILFLEVYMIDLFSSTVEYFWSFTI